MDDAVKRSLEMFEERVRWLKFTQILKFM
jgi:hypothetical protein